MALTNCSECQASVSDSALKCPSCGFQLRKPKRGFFGKVFKWVFILFNALMVVWLLSYFSYIGDAMNQSTDKYQQAGTTIGATMGTGMLLSVWVIGDIILGLFVLFTRPKS